MRTRFYMFISVLATCCFLCGCNEDVKKDALEKYIYVNKSSLDMFIGDEVQLTASPVEESFEWTSADPAVATVTAEGLIEAVGVGSTEITVSQESSQTLIPVNVAIPTADKVVVAGENGRLQIAVQTLSERISTVRLIWNGNRDSIDISVNNQAGIFTRTVDYSGENGYVFQIVSFDRFGNRSASSETTAVLLRNRDLSAGAMDDGSLTIQWGDNTQYIDHCILSYVNQSGQTVSRNVLPSEMLTEINDYSSDLSLTTLFMLIPPSEIFRLDVITPALVESLPFKGPHIFSASAICEIAVRDFDFGGEGLAFHDSNTNNDPGGSYRADNGDPAGVAADIEGGGNTGYTNAGEWLVYTVEVQDEGLYAADVLLSVNSGDGGAFSISVDGNKSEKTVAPNNSNWSDWRWVFERYPDLKSTQSKFYLTAGKHKVRFSYESGGFNLMALRFTNISGSGVPSITPFSSWSFEDPSDLAKANVNSGIQGIPLGLFGNITPVEGPSPTNKAVRIDAGSSNYLKVFHGMLPSDAGYVADWTMMVVFKIPELDRWRTILQTDITPAGDADFFVRDNGQIGVGAIGYYGPALEAGNWYRLIISRQNAFVTSHVNGIQYHNYANGGDNRFNLLEAFLVSQDEDGEDGIIDIAEIAVWNVPLNEAQRALIETEQQNK